MSTEATSPRRTWDDPETCPFCGTHLTDGGAGFIDHVAISDGCSARFDIWRQQVAGDVGGEWSG